MVELLEAAEAAISASPGGRTRFFDLADFPWAKKLEAAWPAMRAEVDCLLTALDLLPGYEDISHVQRQITQNNRWKIYPLYAHDHDASKIGRRCPASIEALKDIPGLKLAMFSILRANSELTPHRGPYSGVLRYHLGIKVPKPETQCGISIDGELAHWRDGESLIFDDSFVHHAWNRSQEDRVVLFVDFVRPLPAEVAELNAKVIEAIGEGEYVTSAVHNWWAWEAIHGQELDQIMARLHLDSAA